MLRSFLNVQSDADFVLVVAWALACLRNRGPYPVIVLSGEQGSAKSTFSAILRALLDPNTAPLRALPREDRDLFIAASNGHVLAFDNVSGLPAWISDTLCRLATGGGFAVRQLYTDQDEVLFDAARPVILNGIEDIVTRPDLADRAVFLTLEPIPEERRRPEAELWAAFEAERPRILGVLLDAVAEGLRRLPDTHLPKLPRMADFALWATACETALWPAGTFWSAYCGNRDEAVEGVIDADPVAAAVRAVMLERTEWTGTASDLLGALAEAAGERIAKSKTWPDSPRALSGRLRRAATFLRKIGIEVAFEREGRARTRVIRITAATRRRRIREGRNRPHRPHRPRSKESASRRTASHCRIADGGPQCGRYEGAIPPDRPRQPPGIQRCDRCGRCGRKSLRTIRAGKNGDWRLEGAAMSAAEALQAARNAGIRLHVDGGELVLEASAPPPAAVLDLLSRHKADVIAMLRPDGERLVGRGLARLLRRAGGHRRVRWRAAALRGRGPRLRLLHRRMAEPQPRALAARPLPRLWRTRAGPRHAVARSAPKRPAMPGCITAAGARGMRAGQDEAAAALAAMGIAEKEHPSMTKKKPAKGNEPTTVVANDPDDRKGALEDHRRFAVRPLEQHARQSGGAGAVGEELRRGGTGQAS